MNDPQVKEIPESPEAEWVQWHNVGPNKAWSEAIREGVIQQTRNEIYRAGRGFAWGKYIL